MKTLRLDKFSIRRRLYIMGAIFLIPMIMITCFFLYTLNRFCKSYDDIVQNVTLANRYNTVFKPEMDAVMYQMVINAVSKEDTQAELNLESPDSMIAGAKNTFLLLSSTSTSNRAKNQLKIIGKLLNTLQKNVNNIDDNILEDGTYDENVSMLENDIYILTELIQENISKYIYFEAANMENIRDEMENEKNRVMVMSGIIIGTIVIFVTVQSYLISVSITEPIKQLVHATEQVGKGNFEVISYTDEGEENEIIRLNTSFNKMTKRIGDLVESIRTEQENSKNLELKLLQSQINPHFLYNTLDNIVWLSEDDRKEDVAGLVTSLSQFFRTTLSGGKDFITIAAEISHIDAYLQIQSFRYRDILSYDILVSDKFDGYKIIKMTLQPIVENALYHGIKNKRSGGKITIDAVDLGENIKIIVSDNGMGMTEEQLQQCRDLVDGKADPDENNGGFGMANVAERLRLNYGDTYGIKIFSNYGEGTRVEVVIPKQEV